jgi:hypothetical protein
MEITLPDITEQHKMCSVCKEQKILAEFHKHPHTRDRRQSQCRKCDLIQKRQRVKSRKQFLVELLGGRCSKCGYSKCLAALEFHHPDENKENDVSAILQCFETAKTEALRCILLCANCHREEHEILFEKSGARL